MGADDILRVIPNPGGGVEVRFAIGKLSQLSVAARQDLAKRMADDVHREHESDRGETLTESS